MIGLYILGAIFALSFSIGLGFALALLAPRIMPGMFKQFDQTPFSRGDDE